MKEKPHREGDFAVKSTIGERNKQLAQAAKEGNINAVNQLLETKININNTTGSSVGNTVLALACYYKHLNIVKALVKAGAKVITKNREGKTPLNIACDAYEGNSKVVADIVKILLENGADPNIIKKGEDGPLQYAAMYGHAEAIKLLIKHGADVNRKGAYKRTALIYAASDAYYSEDVKLKIVKMLLEANANVKLKNESGENALFELITNDNSNTVVAELLIENGIDIHEIGSYDNTALHWAAFCGRKNIVEMLIKKGARAKDISSAVSEAISRGHTDIVKLLFKNGAGSNNGDDFGSSILEYAVEKGDMPFVKEIIGTAKKEGKNLSAGALIEAARKGELKMVKFLIEAGISVDDKEHWGSETPLMKASYYGKLDVVKYLLEAGADIKARDYRGNTALLHAAWSGHLKVIKELIKQGANVNEKNDLNWNALMQACLENHYSTVKFLLEKGSPTDEIDKEKGATALSLAKHCQSKKIIDLLLSYGAKERAVKMKQDEEQYFSIFDCDICYYLPHKKDLSRTESPEDFEGLEIIHSEITNPDRYTDQTDMIKKCTNCGTYYHHDHSYDDEDSFIGGPSISQDFQRYNLIRLKSVLQNIKKKSELKEFKKDIPN